MATTTMMLTTMLLLMLLMLFAAERVDAAVFEDFQNARPVDGLVELVPFVPPVAYDNLDGDRTMTIAAPSAGLLLVHATHQLDPRCYTERVVESRFNSPLLSSSPFARIAYSSKRMVRTYRQGQGSMLRSDFDRASEPVESEGFCQRELSTFDNFLNGRRDVS
ncbi:hypothetical protein ATCC90586_011133 [Pythium insidiosum]|nr:hypothetical protein ATCC90586_011133 [Pythium insidiosum]